MGRKLCSCGKAQAVRPGGLCNKCFGRETAAGAGEPNVQTEMLPVGLVKIDAGTQARVATDEATVARYAAAWADAEDPPDFPPVDVFYDGAAYWLADGFHRLLSAVRAGVPTIKARIHNGTQLDALIYAAGANAAHGLPRTDADKAKAVRLLLEACPHYSTAQLKSAARVSWAFADRVRKLVEGDDAPETRTGADGKTYPAHVQPLAREAGVDLMESPPPADFAFMEGGQPLAREAGKEKPADDDADALGEPLPPESVEAFRAFDRFVQIEKQLKAVVQQVNDLAHLPGSEVYRSKLRVEARDGQERFHCADLANAILKLRDHRPHAAKCPACAKKGRPNSANCDWCKGLPYLTERVHKRAAESVAAGKKAS